MKIQSKTICTLVALTFLFSSEVLISQQRYRKASDPRLHNEIKDDDYVPSLNKTQGSTPAYNYTMGIINTVQVNVDNNGRNIAGDAANEPSIAVDPNNRNRMAIGWRQFNTISSNFRQAGYGYSTDGGQTWKFPGVIEPGVFRSDPVLDSDADGNFYYNSLTNVPGYMCHVFKSSNGGAAWDSGTYAQGGDKQWMVIDKSSSTGRGYIYAFWTKYYSSCEPGFFTRSTDRAESFEECTEIPGEPYWGTLAVGASGELYVGASIGETFMVGKSLNAANHKDTVTWETAEVVDLDGYITFGSGPNPGGLGGQTNVAVDVSGGPHNGNVYLLCSVVRNSVQDPLDVMFARSTDGGVTFYPPIKINDDTTTSAYQWFGTMSVAPNGRIDAVWLDTRDNPGTYLSALYYSNSKDGGETWSKNTRLSDYFNPHLGWPQQNKMGDYFHMISENEGAHLAWAATFTGGQDVYYSYIADTVSIPVSAEVENIISNYALLQNYPNPFNPGTSISYQVPVSSTVTLKIYDILGNEIAVLVNGQKPAGKYKVEFNSQSLTSGVYFYTLRAGGYTETKKMILEK